MYQENKAEAIKSIAGPNREDIRILDSIRAVPAADWI
jgi:hypothetical protein